MNNDNFVIDDSDLIPAREICRYIDNPDIRNRATANSTAALIAKKYFEEHDIDITTGLHNVAQLLEDIEISDVYINDNYIDVRLYFNDNELCVPKSHFDYDILPTAYMFIKLNEDLTGALVTGFIPPNAINTEYEINGYYPVKEEDLISYYDIETFLVHKNETDLTPEIEAKVFDYLDDKLEDKSTFYRELIESRALRQKLILAAKAKIVFNFVSICEPTLTIETETNISEDLIEESGDLELNIDLSTTDDLEDLTEIQTDDELPDIEELDTILEDEQLEENILLEEDSAEILDSNSSIEEETIEEETQLLESDEIISSEEENNEIIPLADFIPDEEDSGITVPIEDYYPEEAEDNETLEIQEEDNVGVIEEEEEEDNNNNKFPTSITPSIEAYEIQEEIPENGEEIESENKDVEDSNTENSNAEDSETEDSETPAIDTLFNNDSEDEEIKEEFITPQKKKSLLLPILGAAVILAAAGYFGYTKFASPTPLTNEVQDKNTATNINNEEVSVVQETEAMPLETVENTEKQVTNNEGNAVSIPAIEQNLDASILVSNLSVQWEVPVAYSNNAAAKRYFTKMGKIIQLNLKTELLLLNKPPITNKIALELEFNKGANKFQLKGITSSSGEENVDNVITKTVKNALNMNLNINLSSFGSIQGNPILIIKL